MATQASAICGRLLATPELRRHIAELESMVSQQSFQRLVAGLSVGRAVGRLT